MNARHLLAIDGLSREEIVGYLDSAETFFSRGRTARDDSMRGKIIVNLFFENSTRTRTSFELAGKRMGADVINLAVAQSSTTKGETLLDTAKTIEAMRTDVLVIRHPSSGAPALIAKRTSASIINAGDGTHEHPTQALLDAFTIRREKGRIEGLVIAICGDILHSRVARSNVHCLTKLGATVRFAGPRTLLPMAGESLGAAMFDRIEPALEGADVVMMLRVQRERLGGPLLPSTREYGRMYGLSLRRFALAKPDAIVMHPGPMNRGVEIDPLVADSPRSVVLDQVEAGLAVRGAVLHAVANADCG